MTHTIVEFYSKNKFEELELLVGFITRIYYDALSSHQQIALQSDNYTDTLHADLYTFIVISRSFCLRTRNVTDKICIENKKKTNFVSSNSPLSPPPRKTCLLWDNVVKNIVGPGRPQVAIRRLRFLWWIHKATNTHSENVIFIVFFPPLQKWLHERTSLLLHSYIDWLFIVLCCLHYPLVSHDDLNMCLFLRN